MDDEDLDRFLFGLALNVASEITLIVANLVGLAIVLYFIYKMR